MGPKNKFKAIFLIVLAFAVSLMLVFGTIDYIANHRTFESVSYTHLADGYGRFKLRS